MRLTIAAIVLAAGVIPAQARIDTQIVDFVCGQKYITINPQRGIVELGTGDESSIKETPILKMTTAAPQGRVIVQVDFAGHRLSYGNSNTGLTGMLYSYGSVQPCQVTHLP